MVALESTLISHGRPYSRNLGIARAMQEAVRSVGAVPATIAVLNGGPAVGVEDAEIQYLACNRGVPKCSRRDLPIAVARAWMALPQYRHYDLGASV